MLPPSIGVMHDLLGPATLLCLIEAVEHVRGLAVRLHRPADHAPTLEVDHYCEVQHALCVEICVMSATHTCRGGKVLLEATWGWSDRRTSRLGRDRPFTAAHAVQTGRSHQPRGALAPDKHPRHAKLRSNPGRALSSLQLGVDRKNAVGQPGVFAGPLRRQARSPGVLAATGYAQDRVDGCNREEGPVCVDRSEDGSRVFVFCANQAASRNPSFARISGSSFRRLFFLRSRSTSFRSGESGLEVGSASALRIQLRMVHSEGWRSSASSRGVGPIRYKARIRSRKTSV